MELQVLLWILGGGFTGTWGLCILFMVRSDNSLNTLKSEVMTDIREIRSEISELKNCVKDHHARISVTEKELEL